MQGGIYDKEILRRIGDLTVTLLRSLHCKSNSSVASPIPFLEPWLLCRLWPAWSVWLGQLTWHQ